jgi:DNA repair protein RAD16
MRTTRARRKRSAESDDGNPSVSTKPATKRRAVRKELYVEITAPSANVSVGIGPDSHGPGLIVIAHLKSSKDKGKGKAPSNFVDGLEDDIVPDSEVNLRYDEAVAPEDESDDSDSDFEALDFEDEGDSDISFLGIRKVPPKKASRVDTRHVDTPEEVEDMMFTAAAEASLRDFMIREMMSGGASTSAGSSGHNIPGLTGLTAPMEINYVDYDVVSDSEPEGDLLEPIVQMDWMTPAKVKGRNKGQWNAEYNADDTPQDTLSVRREARRQARLEKQDIRMLEYQLGRRLTHVGLADIFCSLFYSFYFSYLILTQAEKSTIQLQRHHPELRDAWGDLEAGVGIVAPQKAEQPSRLRATLLPFQQESLYWMRNQEFGQYAGGLLAVSLVLLLEVMLVLTLNLGRTRWGKLTLRALGINPDGFVGWVRRSR